MSESGHVELLQEGDLRFQLKGTVNLATVMSLHELVDLKLPADQQVTLDVSGLEVEGSAVLGLLVHVMRRAAAGGGEVVIENPSQKLRKIAELADVQGILRL